MSGHHFAPLRQIPRTPENDKNHFCPRPGSPHSKKQTLSTLNSQHDSGFCAARGNPATHFGNPSQTLCQVTSEPVLYTYRFAHRRRSAIRPPIIFALSHLHGLPCVRPRLKSASSLLRQPLGATGWEREGLDRPLLYQGTTSKARPEQALSQARCASNGCHKELAIIRALAPERQP